METKGNGANFLSIREVADELTVSANLVRRLMRDGLLSFHRIGGNIRIRRDDLNEYLGRVRVPVGSN